MGLSFLSPAALGLAALVALPILAHMSLQAPKTRVPFGAMMLMERVVKRLRRRRRIKDPFLLLLRLLALLAIIAAVGGARWQYEGGTPEFGGTGRVVLVVDQSLSMSLQDRGSSLLSRARDDASSVVRELPPGTSLGLVAFSDDAVRLTPELVADQNLVLSRISDIEATGGTSNLKAALREARKLLGGEPGEIMLFSDEAGPVMVADARSELELVIADGSAVIPRPVKAEPPRNIAVSSAVYGAGIEGGVVSLKVTNYGPDPVEVSCTVLLPDGQQVPIFIDIPAEDVGEERITVPRKADGGVGEVRCDDTGLAGDDVRWFHLPRVGASQVLVVDGDPGDTPSRSEVYFLERALSPWGGMQSGVHVEVVPPAGLAHLDPEVHSVVFMANVADPRTPGPKLVDFVRRGGALVITSGSNLSADRYNAALGSILPAPLRKPKALAASGELGQPLMIPEAGLDIFEPFSRSGRAGFAKVRARRVMLLESYEDSADVTTLLSYEGNIPALVERRVGAGRVLFFSSTVDFDWTNLPVEAVFMPLVQRMAGWLGGESGGQAARLHAMVADKVRVPLADVALEPVVTGPGGSAVASRIEGAVLLFDADEPGPYEVGLPDAPPLAWVAVNVDSDESDVRVYQAVAAAEAELAPEMFLRTIELGRPLFGGGLVFLLLQALIALRRSE